MDSIALLKNHDIAISKKRDSLPLSPFGVLSGAFSDEVRSRHGSETGLYFPYLELEFLEDQAEEIPAPPAPARKPEKPVQINLNLIVQNMGGEAAAQAAQRILQRAQSIELRLAGGQLRTGAGHFRPAAQNRPAQNELLRLSREAAGTAHFRRMGNELNAAQRYRMAARPGTDRDETKKNEQNTRAELSGARQNETADAVRLAAALRSVGVDVQTRVRPANSPARYMGSMLRPIGIGGEELSVLAQLRGSRSSSIAASRPAPKPRAAKQEAQSASRAMLFSDVLHQAQKSGVTFAPDLPPEAPDGTENVNISGMPPRQAEEAARPHTRADYSAAQVKKRQRAEEGPYVPSFMQAARSAPEISGAPAAVGAESVFQNVLTAPLELEFVTQQESAETENAAARQSREEDAARQAAQVVEKAVQSVVRELAQATVRRPAAVRPAEGAANAAPEAVPAAKTETNEPRPARNDTAAPVSAAERTNAGYIYDPYSQYAPSRPDRKTVSAEEPRATADHTAPISSAGDTAEQSMRRETAFSETAGAAANEADRTERREPKEIRDTERDPAQQPTPIDRKTPTALMQPEHGAAEAAANLLSAARQGAAAESRTNEFGSLQMPIPPMELEFLRDEANQTAEPANDAHPANLSETLRRTQSLLAKELLNDPTLRGAVRQTEQAAQTARTGQTAQPQTTVAARDGEVRASFGAAEHRGTARPTAEPADHSGAAQTPAEPMRHSERSLPAAEPERERQNARAALLPSLPKPEYGTAEAAANLLSAARQGTAAEGRENGFGGLQMPIPPMELEFLRDEANQTAEPANDAHPANLSETLRRTQSLLAKELLNDPTLRGAVRQTEQAAQTARMGQTAQPQTTVAARDGEVRASEVRASFGSAEHRGTARPTAEPADHSGAAQPAVEAASHSAAALLTEQNARAASLPALPKPEYGTAEAAANLLSAARQGTAAEGRENGFGGLQMPIPPMELEFLRDEANQTAEPANDAHPANLSETLRRTQSLLAKELLNDPTLRGAVRQTEQAAQTARMGQTAQPQTTVAARDGEVRASEVRASFGSAEHRGTARPTAEPADHSGAVQTPAEPMRYSERSLPAAESERERQNESAALLSALTQPEHGASEAAAALIAAAAQGSGGFASLPGGMEAALPPLELSFLQETLQEESIRTNGAPLSPAALRQAAEQVQMLLMQDSKRETLNDPLSAQTQNRSGTARRNGFRDSFAEGKDDALGARHTGGAAAAQVAQSGPMAAEKTAERPVADASRAVTAEQKASAASMTEAVVRAAEEAAARSRTESKSSSAASVHAAEETAAELLPAVDWTALSEPLEAARAQEALAQMTAAQQLAAAPELIHRTEENSAAASEPQEAEPLRRTEMERLIHTAARMTAERILKNTALSPSVRENLRSDAVGTGSGAQRAARPGLNTQMGAAAQRSLALHRELSAAAGQNAAPGTQEMSAAGDTARLKQSGIAPARALTHKNGETAARAQTAMAGRARNEIGVLNRLLDESAPTVGTEPMPPLTYQMPPSAEEAGQGQTAANTFDPFAEAAQLLNDGTARQTVSAMSGTPSVQGVQGEAAWPELSMEYSSPYLALDRQIEATVSRRMSQTEATALHSSVQPMGMQTPAGQFMADKAAPGPMGTLNRLSAPPQSEQIVWQNPYLSASPGGDITLREKPEKKPPEPQPQRRSPALSDADVRRMADQVFRLVKERIRRERRSMGLE